MAIYSPDTRTNDNSVDGQWEHCERGVLNFGKAFDSVNHRFLLSKLDSFGLCEKGVR